MTNTQILEEAAEWLVTLRDSGTDSPVRTEFTAWLCKSPEHVRAYLEVTSIWADAAGVDAGGTLDAQTLIARASAEGNVVALEKVHAAPREIEGASAAPSSAAGVRKQDASGRFARIRRGLFAAAVAVAVVTGGVAWRHMHRYPVYVAGVGEQRSITLADGSTVELNSRSRIRIRFSAEERVIDLLEGQGLFRVEKNPQRPFIVRSEDVHVRAVGTQFDVYRKRHGTVVTVLEGRVEVSAAPASGPAPTRDAISSGSSGAPATQDEAQQKSGRSAVQLRAGQQVTVAADRIARPTIADVAAATAWTERQLVFDAAPLIDVAQEFNRYNVRRVVIGDVQLEGMLISGVFSSTDPSSLLRFLGEQPDLVVETSESEIRISRRE